MPRILIRGDGVAACCCGLLLRRAGYEVHFDATARRRLPVVMLSDAALGLMRDVFGQPGLFRDSPRILRRFVAWGAGTDVAALDHGAVVVSEEELLGALEAPESNIGFDAPPDWAIVASRPLPVETVEHRFGSRSATAVPVELADSAEPAACWMESLEDGWLFLITTRPGSGWMLSVGAPTTELLEKSRLVAGRVARCGEAIGTFPSSPRILSPLCGPGWLACGTAAVTFDPICGDGTANAVREAILGAAVIQAIEDGGDSPSVLAHYEGRITAGFRKHLEISLGFYRSGGKSAWWQSETNSLLSGMAFCDSRLEATGAFKYRLAGFRLERLECYT